MDTAKVPNCYQRLQTLKVPNTQQNLHPQNSYLEHSFNSTMSCLPILDESVWRAKSLKPRMATVSVKNIIGTSFLSACRYYSNWTPKVKNRRWVRVYTAIKHGKHVNEIGGRSPICLIKTPDGKYWVASDGNHRVSVAKVLGIKKIRAEVIDFIPKQKYPLIKPQLSTRSRTSRACRG